MPAPVGGPDVSYYTSPSEDFSRPGQIWLPVAGKDAFLAHHPDRRAVADRAYLTSWALAHYLTFGRRVIGSILLHKIRQVLRPELWMI